MRSRKPAGSFAPHEVRRFILPITLTSIVIMIGLILASLLNESSVNVGLILYACVVIAGTLINNSVIVRTVDFRQSYGWLNAILSGIGLGLLPYIVPERLIEVTHILVPLGVVAISIISGHRYGYMALLLLLILSVPYAGDTLRNSVDILEFAVPYTVSIVVMEAITRIQDTAQQHVYRLETINKVSRQIMLSLEKERTISLLDTTIQDALEADTYFVGILRENEIQLDLFYDDGEYYNGEKIPLEGTLSGWIVRNQKELFLPDLRKEVELEGVKVYVVGKERTNLSWMGVPLTAANVTGLVTTTSGSSLMYPL